MLPEDPSGERYRALFDKMPEGFALHEIVCDDRGVPCDYRFLDANPAFERLTGFRRQAVLGKTVLEALPGTEPVWIERYGRVALTGEPARFEGYSAALKRHYEVFAYRPVPGQVAVLFTDITERKQREAEFQRLNRTLRVISDSNQAMMRITDEVGLLQETCRIVVEDCGHRMVWIGYAEEDAAKTVRPVAHHGFEEGYLETLKITWADTERGRGPTGTAIRTGRPTGCRNMLTDPAFAPWRAEAVRRGYASSLVIPLLADSKAFGAINIYSTEPDPFSADEVRLLAELADDLAHGIAAVRLRAERARAEEALATSEARYRRLFESAKDGILILSAETGMIEDANPFLVEMLGYPRDQFLGKQVWELGFMRDVAANQANFRELQEKGYVRYEDMPLETADGRRINVEFVSNVYRIDHRKVVQCNIRDITERKQAELALHQYREHLEDLVRERTAALRDASDSRDAERRRFQEILDALPAYVVLLTPDYHVPFANRFFEERFGKSGGKRCYQYLFKRAEPCENCETFKALKTNAPHHWEWLGPDGRNYDIHDFPFTDADGSPLILEMGLDITERKRTEAELKKTTEHLFQAQKMEAVGRLAGGVAHDFNNLMTVVAGYGRRVLRDGALAAAHRAAVEQMIKAGERAVNLTRQLLTFSRKQIVNPVVLDLNGIINETRKMMPALLGEDIEAVYDLQDGLRPVMADPTQITQVIMNLSANARDAMPAGGRLTVRTADVQALADNGRVHADLPEGRYVLLAVSDTGEGMTEETREHIFEPFFTTKGPGAGTGLGLSSVYGIVKQSGGHIRVDSEFGRGTTFSLYFPASAAGSAGGAAPQSPSGQEAPASRGSETILLLEDEPSVCSLLTTEFRELGYRVLPCKNAGDAIREAEAHEGPVDILLSDIVLPGMSGPTLAKMLQARGKVKRVLLMSGHSEKHMAQHGAPEDGVEFISKPFTAEALAQRIRELLDGKTARQ